MDTRTLQTFLKVVDLRSFTKAAQELGYAQSTVTAQIRLLEEELGYPLFDRIGRTVFLTESGKSFTTYASEIIRLAEQGRFIAKEEQETVGTLRIGVLESLLFAVMTDVLPKYRRLYPKVNVQIKMGSARDLLHWLKENQLDMVYYSHDRCDDPDLHLCYLRQEQLCFVAAPDHPLCGTDSVSLEDVLSKPMIMPERTGLCWRRLEKLAAEYTLPLHCSTEVTSIRAIAQLLPSGTVCSFLPYYSIQEQLISGTLKQLNVQIPQQIYYSQIVYHRNKWIPPYQNAMIELIRKERPES